MRAPSRALLEKAAFVLSLVLLAFGYGWVSGEQGWFPDELLERAWQQGDREMATRSSPPDFTNRRVYRESGITTLEAEAMQPGLTLLVSSWEAFGWDPGLALVDRNGRVHHQWRVQPTELFSRSDYRRGADLAEQDLHGTYLFPNGDVLVNVEYAGTARLDACGGVRWRLNEGNHHSVERASDGTFWVPGVTRARPARSQEYPDGFPGLPDGIHHGLLVQIDAEAPEVVRFLDVLDVLYDNGLERYIPKNRQHDRSDVVHMNDIEPLTAEMADEYPLFEAGDLLVSLRNLDLVLVLDPESEPFYTAHRGKWQHLENGNLLLAESDAGRVVEVAPDGRTVWEWIAPPYSETRVPSVTRAARVDLTAEEVAEWPCSRASRERDGKGGE